MSLTIERTFHLGSQAGRRGGSRRVVRKGAEPEPPPVTSVSGRIPRIAKLMALAIRCEQLLRSGAVPDATALARLAHVSQPRITQILNLTLLAPDIQECLLHRRFVDSEKPTIHERLLRPLCAEIHWNRQRQRWLTLVAQAAAGEICRLDSLSGTTCLPSWLDGMSSASSCEKYRGRFGVKEEEGHKSMHLCPSSASKAPRVMHRCRDSAQASLSVTRHSPD